MLENVWSYLLPHTQSLLYAAAFLVLLEYLIPASRTQKKWRSDSALDLTYSYLLPVLLTPARMGVMMLLAGALLGTLPPPGPNPDGPTLQQSLQVAPDHGKGSFDSDGNFTYTPEPGFYGMDRFVILRTDGRNRVVTQLDFEGSFWGQEEVLETLETVASAATNALRGTEPDTPFPRLTWREAMDRYGTDKPDIRFEMTIHDLGAVFDATEFKAFAGVLAGGGTVRGINAGPLELSRSGLDALVARAQELGAKGLVWMVVEEDQSLRSPVAKFLSEDEQRGLRDELGADNADVLLIVADEPGVVLRVLGQLRLELGQPDGHEELAYLFVVDFPVFERNEDGEFVALHHPFTAPVDVEQMRGDPTRRKG